MPRFIDRTGGRFGALTVLSRGLDALDRTGRARWLCRCDCGNETLIAASSFTRGLTTSCGCGIFRSERSRVDIHGRKFGALTAMDPTSRRQGGSVVWLCRCECGNTREYSNATLSSGRATSCGCQRRVHGHSGNGKDRKRSPTYQSWQNMIARCTQPSSPDFAHYSSRGITVCDHWRSFENFLADMGERPPDSGTLDRIDNDQGYEPGNCRWATWRTQGNNRITNVHFTYQGRAFTLADLARYTGVKKDLLRTRLVRQTGWTVEGAIATPSFRRGGRHTYFRA